MIQAWGRKIRKPVGNVYRFLKTYVKNRYIAHHLTQLMHLPLEYFSVLKNRPIEENEVVERLQNGDIILVPDLIKKLQLQSDFEQLIGDFFDLEYNKLSQIHRLKSIEELVKGALSIRQSVSLLKLQTSILKRLMQPHSTSVYLEMQPNLRVHPPFGHIRNHEDYIEKYLGRGKINPHGQHKDSWRYHPENTLNIWVALTDVNEQNGISILPQSLKYQPKFSASEQEVLQEVKTYPSQHWVSHLNAGDAVLFSAELLHGSIINLSSNSRACLTMRSTIGAPTFHERVSTNYIKLTGDIFDNMSGSKLRPQGCFEPLSRDLTFEPCEAQKTSVSPVYFDEKKITLRINGRLKDFPRYCPHAGRDLLMGELSQEGHLLCPAHRMSFKGKEQKA